jgi:hypothetical protein
VSDLSNYPPDSDSATTGRRRRDRQDDALWEVHYDDRHKVMPTLVPKPYGWGKMQSTSKDTYFFISEFRRLELDQRPDKTAFLNRLIELHQTETSPNDQFGFSVETCDSAVPHEVTCQSNWGDFYARMFQRVAGLDSDVKGHWEFLDTVLAITYSRVISRLLCALSSSCRTLKPSLIHGDMCDPNYGIDTEPTKSSSGTRVPTMRTSKWRWGCGGGRRSCPPSYPNISGSLWWTQRASRGV